MNKIFILKMLQAVKKTIYDAVYPELKFDKFIEISHDADPADDSIGYIMYEKIGMAKIISDYADDIPQSDVVLIEGSAKIRTISTFYSYTRKELLKSKKNDLALPTRKADSCRQSVEEKMNSIAWFGDAAYNIIGLFFHPNVTKATATNGDWLNALTTAELIMADVKEAITNMKTLTRGRETPTHCLVDSLRYGEMATKFIAGTSISALNKLKEIYPGITFAELEELNTVTPNPVTDADSTNGMFLLRKDANVVTYEIAEDFTQEETQIVNLNAKVICLAQVAGCLPYRPLAMTFVAGL